MPFKFLKKCRQYNVTSKSLFVISVHHLLDTSSTVDCTISSESKGQECLDNVCQRLLIQQPEFFGLRYLVRGKEDEYKWIDLERSLSRQLEKYAAGPKIYLRVRHYVTTGVRHLSDEATRFYYFLQLKSDIYEGKIACDIRTAILLALYCRQAEYDSYQGDKQSKDYLKKSLVLPRNMQGLANDDSMLEGLIMEVLQQQATLAHLTQSRAEEMYIQCCQQLDGYGEERFSAKDTLGNDLLLGLAINGMVVNADNGRQYFPWKDFHTVTIDKRTIKIEQNKLDGDGSIVGSFIFGEADTARYFWKLCISQHKFFKRYIDTATPSSMGSAADVESSGHIGGDSVGYVDYDYGEAAAVEQLQQQQLQQQQQQHMQQQHQLQQQQQQQMLSSNMSLTTSANHSHSQLLGQSSSCLDLSNNNLHSSNGMLHHNNNNEERERLKAMLPTYRPAPDYETAVQLKYRTPSAELHNVTLALAAPGNAYYAGSQPDVHNPGAYNENVVFGHLTAHRYPDVAQPAAALHHHINLYQTQQQQQQQQQPAVGTAQAYLELSRMHMMRHKAPPPYPVNRLSSSSTPDLAVATPRPLQGYRNYVSGSSPDLVSNRTLLNGGQFVALAAGGHGGNMPTSSGATMLHHYIGHMGHSQPYLPPHGTFENLNMIEEQPSIMSQLRQSAMSQAAAQAAVVATQSSPTLPPSGYRSSAPPPASSPQPPPVVVPPQKSTTPTPLQRSVVNGSIEPIYENVPLPQRASGGSSGAAAAHAEAMRQRASSIQSAPPGVVPVPAVRHASSNNVVTVTVNAQPNNEITRNIQKFAADRAVSSEMQFLEPQAPQRAARAASAAPAIGATAPPRQHRSTASLNKSTTVDVISPTGESLHQQFSAMNLSANTSASTSSMFNSTLDTTSSSAASKDGKRKKRWNFLARSKTPDKQKAATLGREKATSSNQHAKLAAKMKLAQDDLNLPNRWSTGVSKPQPISGQYSKDKLCQILNEKLQDTQLFMEFERIPKRRENALYDCALLEENEPKNHDPNFLPYDDNRVRLTPAMDNRHGYVNASYISATVGTKQRFYIVAQSPQESQTMRIFWQCVWEADVYLVVQLTEDMSYIPLSSQQRLEFGQFQVYQEFSQTTDRCTTSKLRLYHAPSRRYRSVWHLQYADWAEQNCPRDVNHFLDFLEELNSVRLASTHEVPPGHNTNPPVLIHCLEGGGRSGVTLTADLLLYTLDHNEDLDIPRVIGQLRHQRDSIIPSLAQYKFIYNLLITYLKRTRLI
ncbi:tyrosine-protein phosphatase non-receptor type 21 [Drosophila persimilis]|uniref:tyrosine-protein phosphatase non-receptor type 21 n=1 Tax=Drosophila persimilis TaxID=7234 RepID=UPI000F08F149|nr:tyrosine-protein phosphatase non-receptor type 21 [Drosophila persimilis]